MFSKNNKDLVRQLFESSEDGDADFKNYSKTVSIGKKIVPDLIEVLIERIRHHHATKSKSDFELAEHQKKLYRELGIDPESDPLAKKSEEFLDLDPSDRRKQGISPATMLASNSDLTIASKLVSDLGLDGIQELCGYLRSKDMVNVAVCALVLFQMEHVPPSIVMAAAAAPTLYIFLSNEPERDFIRQLLMEVLSRSPVSSTVLGMLNNESVREERTAQAEFMTIFYVASQRDFQKLIAEYRKKS